MSSCLQKTIGKLSFIDGFGEAFGLDLDPGRRSLKSVSGALGTIFMAVVTLSYAFFRVEIFLA